MVDDRSETPIVSRGFVGRRRAGSASLPPGQYLTEDFPVLSAGPTPKITLDDWEFTLTTEGGAARKWSWKEFRALPSVPIRTDIHCVTRWSKLATAWEGVSLDTLLDGIATAASFALAESYGGYTTNLPLADLATARRGSPFGTAARISLPSTAGRLDCWFRICTSGRAPSGYAGSG